jgi:hypothetical protein
LDPAPQNGPNIVARGVEHFQPTPGFTPGLLDVVVILPEVALFSGAVPYLPFLAVIFY